VTVLAAAAGPPEFLTQIAALVVAAAVIGYACARLRIVPIVGFLLAGVLIGPNALGVVREREIIDAAAEVGVILLLFTIGIEFSLGRPHGHPPAGPARRLAAGARGRRAHHRRPGARRGGPATRAVHRLLVSLSSTAIVLKLLANRGGTSSTPGVPAWGC
jgi:CPA2 family monovalent cation:H+ antiporter-2